MTENEFVKRVNQMAASVYMNGGETPEVLIIPADTRVEDPGGMIEVGMKGGIEVIKVETSFGTIQVVKDKWCPKDKWYLVDWLTVERIYKQTQRDFPFYALGQVEQKVLEKMDGK